MTAPTAGITCWPATSWALHVAQSPPLAEPIRVVVARVPVGSPPDIIRRVEALMLTDARPSDVVAALDSHTWIWWSRPAPTELAAQQAARKLESWTTTLRLAAAIHAVALAFPAGTPWPTVTEQALDAVQRRAAAAEKAPGRRTKGPRIDWKERAHAAKQRVDLAGLIGQRVALRREGRCWVGQCPFHPDHDPSFYVYTQGDPHYHCYGCQAHGDAVAWVRATESLDFVAAVKRLEQLAGQVDPLPTAPVRSSDEWGGRTPLPTWVAVYADLWPLLTLDPAHRAALRARGLPDPAIDAAGFRSMPADRGGWGLRLKRPGEPERDLRGVPGFSQKQGGWLHGAPGVLIPVRNLDAVVMGAQIRLDAGRGGDRYRWWSTPPDKVDAEGVPLYPGGAALGAQATCATYRTTPWDPAEQGGEVWITEGILKAIVAAEYLGVPVIGLPGLQRPANALSLLRQLQPGRLVLALDADAAGDEAAPRLAAHLAQQFDALWSRGDLLVARWAHQKGLDDALAADEPWDLVPVGAVWPVLAP